MDVEEYMQTAEPAIRRVARRFASRTVPVEDMEQELRIAVLQSIEKFDHDKSEWIKYVSSICKFRAIDTCRLYGHTNRKGEQNKVRPLLNSDVEWTGRQRRPPEPEFEPEQVEEIEWEDLKQVVSTRCVETKMAFDYLQGHTMKWIGRKFGISESRVSQVLATRRGINQIKKIVDHPFRVVTQRKEAKVHSQTNAISIEEAIRIATSPEAIGEIDKKIEAMELELQRLKEFRRAVSPKQKRKMSYNVDEELESKVVEMVKVSPMKPGEIASKLGMTPIRVGRIVAASNKVAKRGAMVVPV